jgi:nucleoside-triphosphatase THEP1
MKELATQQYSMGQLRGLLACCQWCNPQNRDQLSQKFLSALQGSGYTKQAQQFQTFLKQNPDEIRYLILVERGESLAFLIDERLRNDLKRFAISTYSFEEMLAEAVRRAQN